MTPLGNACARFIINHPHCKLSMPEAQIVFTGIWEQLLRAMPQGPAREYGAAFFDWMQSQ
jgi:hypothetical protein